MHNVSLDKKTPDVYMDWKESKQNINDWQNK